MTLSATISLAGQSLSRAALQSGLIARNIASADQPAYARRSIAMGDATGDLRPDIARAVNGQLRASLRSASAETAWLDVIDGKLRMFDAAINAGRTPGAIEAAEARFKAALRTFSEDPAQPAFAIETVEAARGLAETLNSASRMIVEARHVVDDEIAVTVQDINQKLSSLADLNRSIARGHGPMQADLLDTRDALLAGLSDAIGFHVLQNEDQTVFLVADNGAVMLDRDAHLLSFEKREIYLPESDGSPVRLDGIDSTSNASPMKIRSGRLAGLVAWRDDNLSSFQSSVDVLSRQLVDIFAEGESPASRAPGLFVGLQDRDPLSGPVRGLAAAIRLNPAADPTVGGSPFRLRDGGLGASGVLYNPSGDTAFHQRLSALADALSSPWGAGSVASVDELSSVLTRELRSAGADISSRLETNRFQQASLGDALHESVGVDLDRQMEQMLAVEHSYQASAKLLATVDSLLQDLIRMID